MIHIVPVDVPKERVGHDLLCIGRSGAQAEFRFAGEQLLQDGHRVAGHVYRIEWLVCENGIINLILVFAAEWGLLEKHLVDEHTEGPPVNGPAVFLIKQDLSCFS